MSALKGPDRPRDRLSFLSLYLPAGVARQIDFRPTGLTLRQQPVTNELFLPGSVSVRQRLGSPRILRQADGRHRREAALADILAFFEDLDFREAARVPMKGHDL